ncbi:MAG: hypothetical protein JRF50_05835 [Deltaproteobacteria bacterium]|nr:hypothetical protein [Deltaproteobacteria bacterium]
MTAIYDATGRLLDAFFLPYECSFGYLKLLEHVVNQYGIPALKRNDDNWTLEEQLKGEQDPTQVGDALKSLGITPIFALTPQAKGRVERLFGALQDRLIAEMGLRNIKEMAVANMFLTGHFIADYNRRFAIDPEVSQPAWRKVSRNVDIKRIISFRYQRVVGNDKVRQLLDGSWRVYYKDKPIAHTHPTPLKEPIRAKPRRKSHIRASSEERWVYMASAA